MSLSEKRAAAAYEEYCKTQGISPNKEELRGWLQEWRTLDEEQRQDQLQASQREGNMADDEKTQAKEKDWERAKYEVAANYAAARGLDVEDLPDPPDEKIREWLSNEAEALRKTAESLREHERMTAQPQQTESPYQSGAELDGNYTVQEARDRAAHIPGLHERGAAPETEAQRAARWEWEHKEQARDMKEIEAQGPKGEKDTMTDKKNKPPVASVSFGDVTGNVWENERKDGGSFYSATFERTYRDGNGAERTSNSFGISQLGDLKKSADVTEAQMQKLYEEQGKSNSKGETNVTPEEKSRVDQSLKNANIARESIGGASAVSGEPKPNDPSTMDKAREAGQNLNKSGVEMDKE